MNAQQAWMRGRRRRTAAGLGLAACIVLTPTALAAQGGGDRGRPGTPKTDQEMSGEALFYQRCPLCHVFIGRSEAAHSKTELIGLYKRPGVTDEIVRGLIMGGMPGRMPSFRYIFTPKELDDLIAYLKVR